MNHSRFLFYRILLVVCFFITVALSSASTQTQKILILNASHKGDDMSDSILDGIESVLYPKYSNIELYIEYMDIKRHSQKDSFVLLRELYARRYGSTTFHGILACDDLALQFVMDNKNSLFPDVPVIFCGVENLKLNQQQIPEKITGIMEADDLFETLTIAQKFHPDTQQIFVISDHTPTGQARLSRFKTVIQTMPFIPEVVELVPDTVSELIKRVKDIPEKAIVIFLHFSQDSKRNQYTPAKVINMFHHYLKAPLYTAWFLPRANGVLGGKMVNGLTQGKLAANMMTEVLNGKPIETIPILKESPNSYIFNYQQMSRFHIRLSDLPGSSIITHKPTTFLYNYRKVIGYTCMAFACLIGSVLILLANVSRRKKAEQTLEQQIRVLKTFMETIPNPVFFKDDQLRFQQCNVAFQALIGMDDQEIIGKKFQDITTSELAESFELKERMLLNEPGFQSFETPFQRSNGEVFTVIINHATVTDEHGTSAGLIGSIQDITDIRSDRM
ncbi:MAG: PAS domain S-box protein [Candidatus Magnetomorum sp.]|nr:PAS domain S-box protein [Candidatus Magnetomorum sp.]